MSHFLHDDFSRTPVANFNLRPWWYLLIIEMGVMISIPVFLIGGQLGIGLSFRDLVLSVFCGALTLGVIGGLTARLGAVTRCSTALISRVTFGQGGTCVIALVLAMGMTGWWGVQTELFANAVVQLAAQLFHMDIPREIMIGIGGTAMIVTAALGIRAIGRLSYLAVPLLSAGLIYALTSLLKSGGFNSVIQYHPASAGSALGFGTAAAIVTSGFIVGASMNPDYSRFALTKRQAFGYAFADYAFVYPLLLIAAGIIGITYQTKDIMVHLVPPGFSWLIFVMMMFATWAANDCNLYSSSLSLAAVLPKWPRPQLAIFAGIGGIMLAEFHVAEHMVSFLTLLGILIAPISGVFVVNSLGRKNPIELEELKHAPFWRLGPLTAWFSGALLGYLTTPTDAFGLGVLKLTTIPTLDAVIGATLVMLVVKLVGKFSPRSQTVVPETFVTVERSLAGVADDTK